MNLVKKFLLYSVVLGVLVFAGDKADAKSVVYPVPDVVPVTGDCWNGGIWDDCFVDPGNLINMSNTTIKYEAYAHLGSPTGPVLNDGDSIPVGSWIYFTPKPFENTDIQWFLSGVSYDSPYGYWCSTGISCLTLPYTTTGYGWELYFSEPYRVYGDPSFSNQTIANFLGTPWEGFTTWGLFIATPPSVSYSNNGTASLNCVGGACRVDGPGSISATVTFNATNLCVYPSNDWTGGHRVAIGDWNRDNFASYINACQGWDLIIPAQNVAFSLNAVQTSNAPTAPVITGPDTQLVNTQSTFGFTSTDSDGDTLRYGIDWNSDNSVDQWLPSPGYVDSGVGQNGSYTWLTTGNKTFKALAQDSNGANSSWASHSINITPPVPPTAPTNLQASCSGLTSSLNWDVAAGATSYEAVVGSQNLTTNTNSASLSLTSGTYNWSVRACNAGGCSASTNGPVFSCPPPGGDVSATPNNIDYGETTTIVWSTWDTGELPCSVSGGGDVWNGLSGSQPKTLSANTTYRLSCGGTFIGSVSITVNLIPTLSANPRIVNAGSRTTLNYDTNGQTCSLSGFGNVTGTDSVQTEEVNARTTYMLECPIGSASATVEIMPIGFES